jgi:hypothetical protein
MEFSFKPSIQISPGLPHATFFSITVGFESFRFSGCQPRCLFLLWEFPAPKHVFSFCIRKRPLFLPGPFFQKCAPLKSVPFGVPQRFKEPEKEHPDAFLFSQAAVSPLFLLKSGLATSGTEVPLGLAPFLLLVGK